MADQHDEILAKIAEVKTELDEVKKEVGTPKAATNTDLDKKTQEIIAAVKEGKDEKKEAWEAVLEGLGFKDMVAAFKDQSSLTSALPLAFGALGVLLIGKIFDLGKLFNAGLEKLTRAIGRARGNAGAEGRILAMTDSGLPWARRRAEAEAAPVIAMAASTLTPTELTNLKSALEAVNPRIRDFNTEARKMPSHRKLTQAGNAISTKLNPAVSAANPTLIGQIAEKLDKLTDAVKEYNTHRLDVGALNKLNKAVDKSNPEKVKDLAKAMGKLVGAQQRFTPGALPDPGQMRTAAQAAKELARAGGDVARAFNDLKLAARRARDEIAPTA
ncbi:hypothetical protein [Streptomyces sp. NPDC004284]|uniref:hypothetical protein n=1 Tax=Streptomyces sp. NPDC004284 TaxID=3364695 RepID=UPI00369E22F7